VSFIQSINQTANQGTNHSTISPVVHRLLVFNQHSSWFTASVDVKFLWLLTLSTFIFQL
jgi:hypothetical protein